MARVNIDGDSIWISDNVYYHILDLEKKLEWYEKELEKERNKRDSIPLKAKVELYKDLVKSNPLDNNFRRLVILLEEIAEFRITNKIEEDDKVIVLLPEKNILAKVFNKEVISNE